MSQKSYINDKSTLYLISTPIGNMDDISIRAIDTMKKVEAIFCEDTRITGNLLRHFNIKTKLIVNNQHNELENGEKLLTYLSKGMNVGLVTDRGTPIISDPGFHLTKIAISNQYNVVAIPGPTAFVSALVTSGIQGQPFLFYGFLNSKEAKRKKELKKLKSYKETLIFYEAPHRLIKTIENMNEILGNRMCSISREITKKFEEIYRGNLSTILENMDIIKGEYVIVIEGGFETAFENLTIIEHINLYIKEGLSKMDAIKMVAKDRKINKNEIYKIYHEEGEL